MLCCRPLPPGGTGDKHSCFVSCCMRVRWHCLNCIPVLILSLLMTVVLPRVTNHGLRDHNHYWYIMSFFPYSNCQLTSVSPRFHWQNAIRQSPHTVETSPPPVLPDISEAVFIIIHYHYFRIQYSDDILFLRFYVCVIVGLVGEIRRQTNDPCYYQSFPFGELSLSQGARLCVQRDREKTVLVTLWIEWALPHLLSNPTSMGAATPFVQPYLSGRCHTFCPTLPQWALPHLLPNLTSMGGASVSLLATH